MGDKLKKMSIKQKRQLEKLVKKNYEGWIKVAMSIVSGREAAEEVLAKTFLSLCIRITDKKQVKIDIPNAQAYVSRAVYRRGLNYLRDRAKIITISNHELDKFTGNK